MGYGPGSMKVYAETASKKRADAQAAWQRNLLEATSAAQRQAYERYTADEALSVISEFAVDIDKLNIQSEEITSKIFERLSKGLEQHASRLGKTEKSLASYASKKALSISEFENLNKRLIRKRKQQLREMEKDVDKFGRTDVSEFKVDPLEVTYTDPVTGEIKKAGDTVDVQVSNPTQQYAKYKQEFDEMFQQKRVGLQEDESLNTNTPFTFRQFTSTRGAQSAEEYYGQAYEDAPEGTGTGRDLGRVGMRSRFRNIEQRERGRALASIFGTEGFSPWKRKRRRGIADPEAWYVDDNTLRMATGMSADERFQQDYEWAAQQYAKAKQRQEQLPQEAQLAASRTAAEAAQTAQEALDAQRTSLEQTYEQQMSSQIQAETERKKEELAERGQQIKRSEADLKQTLADYYKKKTSRIKAIDSRRGRVKARTKPTQSRPS